MKPTQHYLAIDLGPTEGTLALFVKDEPTSIYEYPLGGDFRHTERIIPALDQLLSQNQRSLLDLAGVVVNQGPGSFTGLRVAFATAKALVASLGVPLYSINGAEARWLSFLSERTSEVAPPSARVVTSLTPVKFLLHAFQDGEGVEEREKLIDRTELEARVGSGRDLLLIDSATHLLLGFPQSAANLILIPSRALSLALAFGRAESETCFTTLSEITSASPFYAGTARFENRPKHLQS